MIRLHPATIALPGAPARRQTGLTLVELMVALVIGLVVAADVLIYIGALDAVFAGVRRVLTPGAAFVFSVEEGTGEGFTLRPSLRYAHGEAYLRRLAAEHGFSVRSLARLALREEQRVPVAGMVVALG